MTIPLSDVNRDKNIIKSTLREFKSYITNEFEQMTQQNDFIYYKSRSDPPETFGQTKHHLEYEAMSDDENAFGNKKGNQKNHNIDMTNLTFGFEYLNSGDFAQYDLNVKPDVTNNTHALYFLEG